MIGRRFKLYGVIPQRSGRDGGQFWLGSYDSYKLPGQPIKHNLGLFWVAPWFYLYDWVHFGNFHYT